MVGATVPERIAALRALMPHQPFLIPGVGAQGGRAEDLGAAFGGRAAGALVAASRSIIFAESPRRAAEELRATLWSTYEAAGAGRSGQLRQRPPRGPGRVTPCCASGHSRSSPSWPR